jgi:hypothetical protein
VPFYPHSENPTGRSKEQLDVSNFSNIQKELKPNKIVNKGNSVFRGRNEDETNKLNSHSMPKAFGGRDQPRIAGGVP